MKSLFLVTTALEETWPENSPILFLGEWCKIYSRKNKWQNLETEVLPNHWDDRNKLYHDYLYLKEFHERLLSDLAVKLNEIHGVNHSKRYWRILIGPWLGYFSQMLFDRWVTIHQALDRYNLSETIIIKQPEEDMIPNGMVEFPHFFLSDEWNHYLYATILEKTNRLKLRYITVSDRFTEKFRISTKNSQKRNKKQFLLSIYNKIAGFCSFQTDAFFISSYLPLRKEIQLNFRFRQIPQIRRLVPVESSETDVHKRDWYLSGESKSEFESFVRSMIPRQIPKSYLEGYAKLVDKANSLPWPSSPKIIWTSNAHNADDVFKAWAADKTEKGCPLVIGQHGGHYGSGKWTFVEDHEVEISDRYLSWGWNDPKRSKVYPLGQIKGKRPLGIDHSAQKRTLLVSAILPRYSYHMYSSVVAGQWLSYQQDLFHFVSELPKFIQDTLIIRLHSEDYKWNQRLRWQEKFPNIELDEGFVSMDHLISQSRLYISTYNATTFLESFTMNIPTIVFWNPEHWELRESAVPYFEELKRVGIFHDTPKSAALHAEKIWDHLDVWWNSEIVQLVRERFCRRYSHLTEDILDRLEIALKEVVASV
ncbi:LIC12162 family transferase [Leptospira limi]|uniref:LIC12162 family protein n=1 Tax=Leptospira limi TaxID=2950023 RepID=A0ABT3LZ16_9LEPT|nr:LIC12162 family protein [Leptospira limi]MCW7462969.1 LIC12162 family protein [Leptospira limi]